MIHKQVEYLMTFFEDFPMLPSILKEKITEKVNQKKHNSFGFYTSEEEVLLAKEIALELSLFHCRIPKMNTNSYKTMILENNCAKKIMEDEETNYENVFSNSEKWSNWQNFFIRLFEIQDISKDKANYFNTVFSLKLSDGTIIQCYTPSYYEFINMYKKEKGEQLEELRYSFHFHRSPVKMSDYLSRYHLTSEVADFIKRSVQNRLNIMICSSESKYNEDFINLLFNLLPMNERIVSVQRGNSIKTNLPHHVMLNVPDDSLKSDFINNSIKMRPERIVVDSLDSESTFWFIQACETGHDGSFCSFELKDIEHLNTSLLKGMSKLNIDNAISEKLISESIDIIIHIEESADKPIVRIYNLEHQNGSNILQSLFDDSLTKQYEDRIPLHIQDKIKYFQPAPTYKEVAVPFIYPLNNDVVKFIDAFENQYEVKINDKIKPLLTHTISLHREMMDEEHIKIGCSKFGGNPDLPLDIPYPYDGKTPYSFVMQINCEDLNVYDLNNQFPDKGMLYFFQKFEDEMIPLSFDYEGEEGLIEFMKATEIFHYDGQISSLVRAETPKSIHIERINTAKIHFGSHYTIPEPYENKLVYKNVGFNEEDLEAFLSDLSEGLHRLPYMPIEEILNSELDTYFDTPFHQLLGEATPIQASPLEELKDDLSNRFEQPINKQEEWLLLCQLGVDEDLNLYWAADGYMYYFIRKEDLLNKNFKNIYSIMQCG